MYGDFRNVRSTNDMSISCSRMFLGNVTKYLKIYFVVKPLQFLFPSKPYEQQLEHMRSLPEHTVGHELAAMLDSED